MIHHNIALEFERNCNFLIQKRRKGNQKFRT